MFEWADKYKYKLMKNFWDERYTGETYAYGISPNQFFKEKIKKLDSGKILFPAEGEGRNAVFAAKLGWEVSAFDLSTEGKRKAEQLAAKNDVVIDYQIAGYEDIQFEKDFFDCIVLIFAHMHPMKRKEYHQKLISFLKPGGTIIVEGFSKKQLQYNSGGPRDLSLLFSKEELQNDFSLLSGFKISETEYVLNEGEFHQGKAAVIRVIGRK